MCPIFRDEKWNPEIKWNITYSGEYINDTAAVEVLRLRVIVKRRYNLISYFRNISYHFNQVQDMKDALLFTSNL